MRVPSPSGRRLAVHRHRPLPPDCRPLWEPRDRLPPVFLAFPRLAVVLWGGVGASGVNSCFGGTDMKMATLCAARWAALLCTAAVLGPGVSIARAYNELAKLTAADTAQNDSFGISVAISGNTALVGHPATTTAAAASPARPTCLMSRRATSSRSSLHPMPRHTTVSAGRSPSAATWPWWGQATAPAARSTCSPRSPNRARSRSDGTGHARRAATAPVTGGWFPRPRIVAAMDRAATTAQPQAFRSRRNAHRAWPRSRRAASPGRRSRCRCPGSASHAAARRS